jgi:hypothetical protein
MSLKILASLIMYKCSYSSSTVVGSDHVHDHIEVANKLSGVKQDRSSASLA